MAVIRGTRTTDTVSSSLIKRDVFEAIFNFKPYQTPISQFFLANNTAKYASGNPKFELQEDTLFPYSDTLGAAITGGGATESITVTTGGYFKVGAIIRNTVANENYRVTSVSSNTVGISSLNGSDLITATANGLSVVRMRKVLLRLRLFRLFQRSPTTTPRFTRRPLASPEPNRPR